MHETHIRTFVALCVPVVLCSCGGREEFYETSFGLDAPTALDSQLLWVDAEARRGHLLDVSGRIEPEALGIELPIGATSKARREGDHDEVLVLCEGHAGDAEEDAAPATLVAVSANGKTRVYELGNPFDSVTQSDDGRYAFLLKSPGESGRLLENPNEVAIVDLDKDPDDDGAVTLRSLTSFGDSPTGIVYSPRMAIVAEERRLAITFSASTVTLIDLGHLDRRETSVQLSGEAGAVLPSQVVFSADEPVLYVRGDSSNDVFVFRLEERPQDEEDVAGTSEPRNDFRPSINQLVVGTAPADIALYEAADGGERLLVLAAGSQELAIVEAASSRVTSVNVSAAYHKILLFKAKAPQDIEVSERALLWSPGSANVVFADLDGIEEAGDRNLEVVSIGAPVNDVITLEDDLLLLVHPPESRKVSLLDLGARTVSPISSAAELDGAIFDPARKVFWVAPKGQDRVAYLDIETGAPSEVRLDADVARLVPVFGSDRIAIEHADPFGYVTVLDANEPTRAKAQSARLYLLAGVLDEGGAP